jgi:hypothetical protein
VDIHVAPGDYTEQSSINIVTIGRRIHGSEMFATAVRRSNADPLTTIRLASTSSSAYLFSVQNATLMVWKLKLFKEIRKKKKNVGVFTCTRLICVIMYVID